MDTPEITTPEQHGLQEYALLRKAIDDALREAMRLQSPSPNLDAHILRDKVIEHLQRALFRFDTQAVLRQCARRRQTE